MTAGTVTVSLFVAGAIFGHVGVSLLVASALFGDVGVSLLLAGAALAEIWVDSRSTICLVRSSTGVVQCRVVLELYFVVKSGTGVVLSSSTL